MQDTPSATSVLSSRQASNAWRVAFILFLINLLNFFDRTIPAVVFEPLRLEFDLSDAQLGLVSAAFTLVYAVAGIPFGRWADSLSRKRILAAGLAVWSALTAATGAVWNYTSLLMVRIGVGIGEASCAPAATSLIGDLFPAEKRSRAMGLYMLGLPLGLVLAFFTVGAMVKAFDSWRAPFFLAAIPGFLLAIFVLFIREPKRGASEATSGSHAAVTQPYRKLARIKTLWWIVLSGIMVQIAGYSGAAFMVALLQRYFGLPIDQAAVVTGGILGVSGLIALTIGARLTDYLHVKSKNGRLLYGGGSLILAAILTFVALRQGAASVTAFALIFGIGWYFYYNYFTTIYPALQDVVVPRLRGTAMAVYFAGQYLLGGAIGPVVAGWLSDKYSMAAMEQAGATEMTEAFKAVGLHDALYIIPVSLLLTGVFILFAIRTYQHDNQEMLASLERSGKPE